ncbi:putative transporter [Actinacidiphila reveromycinica]|uniref:Putative proline/betaine transporter n=1 Tax=Actinacidiphila reveromycinica TaxID=659352 RepID=A0A7U3UV57_9ACTN|nr:putative transporter [Streptomyces sp. SN-593]
MTTGSQSKETRKAIVAGTVGSVLEWYDYFAYGTAASLVFGSVFFPNSSPSNGTLASFATFGVGFAARPIGGFVFSHFGDRLGRKTILVITLLMMGVATALIGALPTYAAIGWCAPLLLVVLRLVQGFAAGGELGGAIVLAVEHTTKDRRAYNTSFMACGVVGGLLLSSGVYTLITYLTTDAQFKAWGWRLPFLLSVVLVAVGMVIRARVTESPVFEEAQEAREQARMPIAEVLRYHWKSVLVVLGARLVDNGVFFVYATYLLSYSTQDLDMDSTTALICLSISCVVALLLIPRFATLSDRIGRKPVFLFGAGFSVVAAFPLFGLVRVGSPVPFTIALILGISIGWGALTSVVGALFAELFPTPVRYSGITLGREIGSVFAGGLSPYIAAALYSSYHSVWPIALFAVGLSVISFVAVAVGPETRGRVLE